MNTLDAARFYKRRGWEPVPYPAPLKGPRTPNWQNLRIGLDELPQHFGEGVNIGVLLGPASGELVDIDLDCAEALALADLYLPPTAAIFGRPSKPSSHRLYIAAGAVFESFADPLADKKPTLLELRAQGDTGGGHQTLFPPSIADGERRQWEGKIIAPAVVGAAALRTTAAWLAVGCLMMRHVGETPARNPGPDLPDLLEEADPALGQAARRWLGRPDRSQPRPHLKSHRELTADEIDLAEAVHAIPNDCDWNGWNDIGMAIWAATGGSDHGAIIFDDWSAKSAKYNPYITADRWRHYDRSPPSRTGVGKLIKLALSAGWRPEPKRAGAR